MPNPLAVEFADQIEDVRKSVRQLEVVLAKNKASPEHLELYRQTKTLMEQMLQEFDKDISDADVLRLLWQQVMDNMQTLGMPQT